MSEQVDVVIVGAGILGINQLYVMREAGFTATVLEAGTGVGGAWYWNRYPGARLDSESFTYAYLFSKELFNEWEWKEHFAGQPDLERYMNHVVDKFDLRRHIHFNARVNSCVWDENAGRWTVRAADGTEVSAKFFVSATGVLSIPYQPKIAGKETFRGEQYNTSTWPKTRVSFEGKGVGIIGTGSSGVQVIPAIADQVKSLTVYQKEANWCMPLNNRPITAEEQKDLRDQFEKYRDILNTSVSGFLHELNQRKAFEDTKEVRLAFYEKMWKAPGFAKIVSHYSDVLLNPEANADWCAFVADKIRSLVKNPATADKLIPKDHRYGEKRPPYGTGYFEAYNNPKVTLLDLNATPILKITEKGIETSEGLRELDMIIWATGFDFGTGALNRMGVRGRGGMALEDHWKEGPTTWAGTVTHGFPNMFFPGGPHGASGNNPRYGEDQVMFVRDLLVYMREHKHDVVEVDAAAEAGWSGMVEHLAPQYSSFTDKSYFYGSNIPGKARRFQLNPGGRPLLMKFFGDSVASGYQGFSFTRP